MQLKKHQYLAFEPKQWLTLQHLCSFMGLVVVVGHATPLQAATFEPEQGFAPFANISHTYDSNLLNRSENGTGPRPQSDQVDRTEIGTHLNLLLSQQKFSGTFSLTDTRHQRFSERNTQGNFHRIRWDSQIGKTIVASLEGSSRSDQAPIQTGIVSVVQRDQDNGSASVKWNFHPFYSALSQVSKTSTRFLGPSNINDPALTGLNRDDELALVGIEWHPGTGSTLALLLKQNNGTFPIRQIIGPGQSVSNNFNQNETELLGKWNFSELTAFTLSLSSVQRDHDELKTRDFSSINYRVEILYKPTQSTNFNLTWGKQILGVSDATNSDALAHQMSISMNMKLTSKTALKLVYIPQDLEFDGTDGLNSVPRTERVKEMDVSLEHELTERTSVAATLRNRSRTSSVANSDYDADSCSIYLKYEF